MKHIHSIGTICCTAASVDGLLFCSVASDKSVKVFDVVNFGNDDQNACNPG